jgi:hypothetical protein
MFLTFPQDARWNAERQAVEFGVEIASTVAWSGSRGACFSGCSPSGPHPSGASKPPTSNEPGSRAFAERKLPRWRAARLPESLASLEEKMTAQLEAVRRVKAAVDPLYEALSDDQKKTADELILGPMGVF